jgi:D-arabinose 1-dehydrogenase-like Zn-dependent alcohol dehydrogenase
MATGRRMKAMELPGPGAPLRLVQRDVPMPGPGEVRVRIQACGVCGSDLFLQDGGFSLDTNGAQALERFPVVPGHEAAGVVDLVGEGVTGLELGRQVAIYYLDPAPDGDWVKRGLANLDPTARRMGVDVDGAFAEFVVRPAHTLIPTSEPMNPAALAVLTDAVATPYHALTTRGRLMAGETLVVLGVGGLGSNAVQLGRHLGARVIAVSRSGAKLELARKLGAHETVLAGAEMRDRVRKLTGPAGPDVVIQCAGSGGLDREAVALAGRGGRVLLVGASHEPFDVLAIDLIWRELSILACARFTVSEINDVIRLYLDGAITVDHLLDAIRPLEEANEALAELRAGTVLRSVLIP